jgi:hypothetical protein
MSAKKRILILCTGNSARSQMAEGPLRHDAGQRFEVFSAGTKPSQIRREAITVTRELGIDISGLCDNAKEKLSHFSRQHLSGLPRAGWRSSAEYATRYGSTFAPTLKR